MAINLALAAGGNPTAFALIVALSASNNFMTASNPVISMITGPAGYQPARTCGASAAPLSLVYTDRDRGDRGQPDVLTRYDVANQTAPSTHLHGELRATPRRGTGRRRIRRLASSKVAPCTAHTSMPVLVS